ncbi:MAG: gamma-glutamyltransferase [Acidobacteriota bacterium]
MAVAAVTVLALGAMQMPGAARQATTGVQEAAWAPDGRRVAVSFLDRLWTMGADGRQARMVTPDEGAGLEREPAWSPDGGEIAFAVDRGSGFDIAVATLSTGRTRVATVATVTAMPGDERWPSWTPDGRLVFAHRAAGAGPGRQWDLYIVAPVAGSTAWGAPVALTATDDSETYPRVSPDGRRVVFVSDRDAEDDVDLWVMPVPAASVTRPVPLGRTSTEPRSAEGARAPRAVRVTRARGVESHPSWDPGGQRIAFHAVRDGIGTVWVATVEPAQAARDEPPVPRARPSAPPVLVSRRGGVPAWSPDGATLLVSGLPDPQPVYNGNPLRSEAEPPPLFATGRAFQLWRVPAPLPVHEDGGELATDLAAPRSQLLAVFDRVWETLRALYYAGGPAAEQWTALRETHRPRAARAGTEADLEAVLDEMVAAQPLIKPVVTSRGAVVVSGHPLASEAGRLAFEKGGNIVDAAIAVSFALGVVEPEASGIGGDGTAVLYLTSMKRPTVIEYKDQTPIAASMDNPLMVRDGRIVADGPAAANIPGVVAGLDLMYRTYGSGKVTWAELIEPAIALAEEGFILDESLPTSIAEGRRFLEKWPAAANIYLPGGQVPRPGDRFVNKDYAATLRTIASEGAEAFYRGSIARKIAADMEAHGGILTFADLAQYRAIEREPIRGQYRGHTLYAGGPPVSTGIQLFESLQILEQYAPRPGARVSTDADYFHHVVEAWKVRDQVRRVADPERWPVEFEEHLTLEHAKKAFQKIDPAKASRYERQTPDDEPTGAGPPARIGTGTTSFVVADAEGNMIAITQTLSTWGGTFYVSEGLGFLYNNHLRSSRTQPGAYGSLLPLMRSSTASVPTLVFERTASGAEVPKLAVGCAGNAWIPVSVYNVILGVIDGGLGAQQAIEAPRFLPGRDPADPLETGGRVEIEDRFPRALVADLTARGHRFHKIGRKGEVRYGYAAAALVDPAKNVVEGAADPRRSHAVAAADRPRSSSQ